jgi:hypothetical protein
MWDYVVIFGGYAFAASFLRLLGGFGAAQDALSRWGAHESRRRAPQLLERLGRQSPGADR